MVTLQKGAIQINARRETIIEDSIDDLDQLGMLDKSILNESPENQSENNFILDKMVQY